MAARKAHNLEVPGSSPGPATKQILNSVIEYSLGCAFMYYAYVLKNPKGILYKGSTDDLIKRTEQHNGKTIFSSFTKKRGPWELVYSEEFATRTEAVEREKFFKSGKGREFLKTKITRAHNPP